jgi:hypothetical protein
MVTVQAELDLEIRHRHSRHQPAIFTLEGDDPEVLPYFQGP